MTNPAGFDTSKARVSRGTYLKTEVSDINNPSFLRSTIFVLSLVTALLHAWLFYTSISPQFAGFYPFLANALGYLILMGLFFLKQIPFKDPARRLVHYAFMLFTVGSIGAWVVMNWYPNFLRGRAPSQLEISIFDKAVEVALLVALFLHLRLITAKRAA